MPDEIHPDNTAIPRRSPAKDPILTTFQKAMIAEATVSRWKRAEASDDPSKQTTGNRK